MRDGDTIVALSSGALPSGIAVIRLSGPATESCLLSLCGSVPEPRRLTLAALRRGSEVLDQGLIAWFPAPDSFTGEDCAELQVHGSPAVVRAILRELTVAPGVRLAEAGEFTRRAFENGKLDLTEVEGLGDLIEAETENQRRQALDRLRGGLSRHIEAWRAALLDMRAEIEARLDFADEGDVAPDLPAALLGSMQALESEIALALGTLRHGRIVREGLRIALAGPPNAGKSSLLNALAKSDIAIVTDEAGTTRDVREVAIDLDGQLVVLLDMAGLRRTESKAEAEGVRRARAEIAAADLVLWLVAPDVPALAPPVLTDAPLWEVATKADLGKAGSAPRLAISTQTGAGLDMLLDQLKSFAAGSTGGEPALLSRERDQEALAAARDALSEAQRNIGALELCAEALRRASHALERLIGRMDAEMVLDRLFLSFCIGK